MANQPDHSATGKEGQDGTQGDVGGQLLGRESGMTADGERQQKQHGGTQLYLLVTTATAQDAARRVALTAANVGCSRSASNEGRAEAQGTLARAHTRKNAGAPAPAPRPMILPPRHQTFLLW